MDANGHQTHSPALGRLPVYKVMCRNMKKIPCVIPLRNLVLDVHITFVADDSVKWTTETTILALLALQTTPYIFQYNMSRRLAKLTIRPDHDICPAHKSQITNNCKAFLFKHNYENFSAYKYETANYCLQFYIY